MCAEPHRSKRSAPDLFFDVIELHEVCDLLKGALLLEGQKVVSLLFSFLRGHAPLLLDDLVAHIALCSFHGQHMIAGQFLIVGPPSGSFPRVQALFILPHTTGSHMSMIMILLELLLYQALKIS